METSQKGQPWSATEVQATIQSYLNMLQQELAGQRYNKAACRQLLFQQLNGIRSPASIEFKHCNISAVMRLLGYPHIKGYQPRFNFQSLLMEEVESQLQQCQALEAIVQFAVTQPAVEYLAPTFDTVQQEPPKRTPKAAEPTATYALHSAAKRDYLAQEARNRSLGLAGEKFVLAYEQWQLEKQGLHKLASRVEHVAESLGDGLGFDVRSFDLHGKEKLIEVKTTSFAKETPFFVTRNELQVSQQESSRFHLYRLYDFRKRPQLFDLPGAIDSHCQLDAQSYRASF
ncbi:DUF3883 domain-containing protein [Comamonas thiooxydans]|uniref:DUF3883 domain-containing protein n=1 Tax=Comamonas thiooxydans TaxID=363952 RepID=UPI00209C698A|nr:DUF3883 domain-containing protein [Comamonas thiooxydans]MCO8249033.1 DUF3883 domain-containing protein [Comamonas thiooxydans]